LKRLAYIDWLRGMACFGMFITHSYDAWLRPAFHDTRFYRATQLVGTLPAPIFLLLAGASIALSTEKLREKGIHRNTIARQTVLRGAEIFGLGLLFRIQEYALGYRWVPWTDLLRVDILNAIGIAMVLAGVLVWLTSAPDIEVARRRGIRAGLFGATLFALLTPPLWTTLRPRFLPWPLESYLNGVHVYQQPQHWLFPIFPWCGFTFAGVALGFALFTGFARLREAMFFVYLAIGGAIAFIASIIFDAAPFQLYSVYDYWHSSPEFFLARCGIMAMLFSVSYAWCRWGFALQGFSPALQLGATTLLVYWVHIEFVYGRLSFLPKHGCNIPLATLGLAIITAAMLGLSIARTRWIKSHRTKKDASISSERPVLANP
jgi:uncharacterized membrane protein